MTGHARTRWPRLLTAALLALLAHGAAAPQGARASCGDYVTVTNPQTSPGPSGHPNPSPVQAAPRPHPTPGEPAPPCRVPGCSRSPLPAPAPASTAGQGAGQDHRDCLLARPVL